MGKKKAANQGPTQQHLQAYQRMNFLHQASILMSTTFTTLPNKNSKSTEKQHQQQSLAPLGRYYNNNMKKIGRKLVLRSDPSVKRAICKRCDTALIPALTASVRTRGTPTAVVTTCKTCGTQKRLVANPKHQLFNDKTENILPTSQTEP
ncbi:RNAse P Rpr2/Rpp21/SNM1 subunit domain-containing protein [Zychaea mexicana]|uniref:RNAse P Rpr2/Rpp21/SNM1 subunit domain-containing protein n=1 Tax=Zychaea mexicana TaxID=64656 RepID=UPI0022FE5B39|nr:RNAse P Rpr2/Rpp21/SNM1 subunit domain-containing protein [Zychaea mexicana]KAI9497094.1 RNAse P Rpr2/Rpp21/SNM1 subunit domain-containing protein [Zychaea mexicana]